MAKYKISGDGIFDNELNHFIPTCSGNRHWVEYQEWTTISGNVADPEFTTQEIEDAAWASLRSDRDVLLAATDFFMMPDYTLASGDLTSLTNYRNSLRDLPGDTVDPESPSWPTKPQIVTDHGI